MDLEVNRKELTAACGVAMQAVSSRATSDLQKVLFSATDKFELSATDKEVGLRVSVPAKIGSPGAFLVPYGILKSLLSTLTSETIAIYQKKSFADLLIFKNGRNELEVKVGSPKTFPTIPDFTAESHYVIQSSELTKCLERTSFAINEANTRYSLGGVCFEVDGELRAIATDGRRMAKMNGSVNKVNGPHPIKSAIIPKKALSMIKSVAGFGTELCLAVNSTLAVMRCGPVTMFSRLLEGRFPGWSDLMQQDADAHSVFVTAGLLESAVRQSLAFTSTEYPGIAFALSRDTIVATCQQPDLGDSKIEFPVTYNGPDMSVALNAKYLMDVLRVLSLDEKLTIRVKNDAEKLQFATEDGYRYVIMPMDKAPS